MNMEQREELFEQSPGFPDPGRAGLYRGPTKAARSLSPTTSVKWNSILQEETLGTILPDLAQGKISPEEFTKKEDESIQEFLEEQ